MLRRNVSALLLLPALLVGCTRLPEDGPAPSAGGSAGAITLAAAGGEGEINALREVVTAFMEANPGVTVSLDAVASPGDLLAKLTTAFAGGNPPDLFLINYRRAGTFAARGVIEPVPEVDRALLYPAPLDAFTFDGQLLCLPSNASSMVVYYNTALFDRARVQVPAPGWTWEQMLTTARALRDAGVPAIGFETALIRMAPFVWSNGGEIVDDPLNPTVIDLSSPPAREALQFMLDLQQTGQSARARAGQEPEEAFAAGNIAMYLDSRRAVPGFRKTEGLQFDVAAVPAKAGAVTVLHSDGYCVPKASRNKDLARAFASFAVTGDGARILAESGRTVPVLRSVAQSDAFLDPASQPRSSQVFLDQLPRARALPNTRNWYEAEEYAEEVLTQLFAGRMGLNQAVETIQTGSRRALARP